jgi:pyruvate dehydrogenase E2 component (dihydrolipoyllysine-residue acetyltransferase)
LTAGGKGEVQIEEPTAAERAVARRAAESRATIPTLELSVAAEASETPRLVWACAQALRRHPRANAAYRDGRFELYSRVNVGIVVADAGQYLVPTLFDADEKPRSEIERELAGLSNGAVSGALPASAFSGATFTVWNAGELGLAAASIPIVPPQAAALAAGRAALTLSCDHRILYGGAAAAFLKSVAHHLDGNRV